MVEPEPNVPVSLHKYIKRLQDSFPMAVAKRFIDVDVLTQAASVSFTPCCRWHRCWCCCCG